MINPTDAHATKALDEVLPRFPKRWHKQLKRLGMDSFSAFISLRAEVPIYTIKSGNTVMMASCRWERRGGTVKGEEAHWLLCELDVIHTRGSAAVTLE